MVFVHSSLLFCSPFRICAVGTGSTGQNLRAFSHYNCGPLPTTLAAYSTATSHPLGAASTLTWKGLEITEINVSIYRGETKAGDIQEFAQGHLSGIFYANPRADLQFSLELTCAVCAHIEKKKQNTHNWLMDLESEYLKDPLLEHEMEKER